MERLKSSSRKFYGRYGDLIQQYDLSLSRILNDILTLDRQWLLNRSDFPPISLPWCRAWPSPNGAFATGVTCQQGTLFLLDTLLRPPFWDLLMFKLLRPDSPNLPCLYSTFHLEYPLVISWVCFTSASVLFIFYFYHHICLCNDFYGFFLLDGCWSSVCIRIYYKYACPFHYTAYVLSQDHNCCEVKSNVHFNITIF